MGRPRTPVATPTTPADVATGTRNGDVAPVEPRSRRRNPWSLPLLLSFVGMAIIGLNSIRVADLPLADVIFLVAAGVVLVQLLMGDTRRLAPPDLRRAPAQWVVGCLVLLSAGIISSLWAVNPGASVVVVMRFAWLTLVWSWLLRSVAVSRVALDRLVDGYRITALLSAAAGIAGYFGMVELTASDSGRQAAFTNHPNHLGGLLAIGLPFLLLDVRTSGANDDRRPGRSLTSRLVLGSFVVFGLSTTGSMSALLAAVAGVATIGVVQMVARGKPRRRHGPLVAMAVTCVVGLAVVGLAASGAPVVERIVGYQEGDAGVSYSVDSRGEQDSFVVDRIDRYLLVGVGFAQGAGEVQIETGHGIHNNVLKLIYEAGLPAVVGLLMLLLVAVQQGTRLLVNTRGTPLHNLMVALLAALVTSTVFAQFHPLAYERYYWFPVVIIGAMWSLRRQELRDSQALAPDERRASANGHAPRRAIGAPTTLS